MANMSLDAEPQLDVSLSQDVLDEEDVFVLNNYGTLEVDVTQWGLNVTGVNEEKTLTLQDLQALPQTEMTVTQVCYTSAINSPFAANHSNEGRAPLRRH